MSCRHVSVAIARRCLFARIFVKWDLTSSRFWWVQWFIGVWRHTRGELKQFHPSWSELRPYIRRTHSPTDAVRKAQTWLLFAFKVERVSRRKRLKEYYCDSCKRRTRIHSRLWLNSSVKLLPWPSFCCFPHPEYASLFISEIDPRIKSPIRTFYASLPGPERHPQEPAVGVVFRRPPPPGENHLAVALRDPAEDQPVRLASQCPACVSHREAPSCVKISACHLWHCCHGWLAATKSIKTCHSHTASETLWTT